MDANTIIEKAKSFLGVKGNPVGSHNVPFNTLYYGYEVNDKNAYYWCVVFVWYVFRMCGASNLFCNGEKANRCSVVESWGKANGLVVNKNDIKPGDLVIFDWQPDNDPDHIGIATSTVVNSTFSTIEGNVNDSVQAMNRNLSQVRTVIRPKYETENYVSCDPATCPILQYLKTLMKGE